MRLAAPNVALVAAQAAASFIESYFIGRLGTDALAGAALVFPLIMLMQMMSAGGMGGGISAAVARALGRKTPLVAEALGLHACIIALTFGLAFTVIMIAAGRPIYAAMGGSGEVLEAALDYSNWVFAGAIFVWLTNSLSAVLRGSGNMLAPATVIIGGLVVLVPVSAALVFGWGPIPALGIAGAGIGFSVYYALGTLVLALILLRGRGGIRLSLRHRVAGSRFREILRVGAPSLVTNIVANLSVAIATSYVGRLGDAALAGFGLGARLEYVQVPISFGVGTACVAMIGRAVGAGEFARARSVALAGSLLAAAVTGTIGCAAALFPAQWLGLFTDSADAIDAGSAYLRVVGPAYGLFGFGMALYFASQGAGELRLPVTAAIMRLVITAALGWLAIEFAPNAIYLSLAIAFAVFAAINGSTFWIGPFRSRVGDDRRAA